MNKLILILLPIMYYSNLYAQDNSYNSVMKSIIDITGGEVARAEETFYNNAFLYVKYSEDEMETFLSSINEFVSSVDSLNVHFRDRAYNNSFEKSGLITSIKDPKDPIIEKPYDTEKPVGIFFEMSKKTDAVYFSVYTNAGRIELLFEIIDHYLQGNGSFFRTSLIEEFEDKSIQYHLSFYHKNDELSPNGFKSSIEKMISELSFIRFVDREWIYDDDVIYREINVNKINGYRIFIEYNLTDKDMFTHFYNNFSN